VARYRAKKAVEAELRSQGIRLTLVPLRDITTQAMEYLRNHHELLDECAECVRNDPELRKMAEAEVRDRERKLRKWQKAQGKWGLLDRSKLSVSITGSANGGTEKTQLFSATSAIFSAWCLLNAD
jgi:hypothetical protein